MNLSILILDDHIRGTIDAFGNAMIPYKATSPAPEFDVANKMDFPKQSLMLTDIADKAITLDIYFNPRMFDDTKTIIEWTNAFIDHKKHIDCILIDDQWGESSKGRHFGQNVILPLLYDQTVFSKAHYCLFTQHSDQEERIKSFVSLLTQKKYRSTGRLNYLAKSDTAGLQVLISLLLGQKLKELELETTKNELEKEREKRFSLGIPDTELPTDPPEGIVGHSRLMQMVYYRISKYASSDKNVYIYGESGVGKELVARAIHDGSERKNEEFITVSGFELGSADPNIDMSNLFGRLPRFLGPEDPGFEGYVVKAKGGTLFLDEVHLLSHTAQGILLRFLQTGKYRALGCLEEEDANVRFLSAANVDLAGLVDKGQFASDLFHRLEADFPFEVPPLRDRKSDIPELVTFFVNKACNNCGLNQIKVEEEAMDAIMNYSWPGNVRVLMNWINDTILMHEKITSGALNSISDYRKNNMKFNNDVTKKIVFSDDIVKIDRKTVEQNIEFCFKYLQQNQGNTPRYIKDMEAFMLEILGKEGGKSKSRTFGQHLYANADDWVRIINDNYEVLKPIVPIIALSKPISKKLRDINLL